MFLVYKIKVKNQLNMQIKRLKSNRKREYNFFDKLCKKQGIIHEITLPYSPKFNNVVERKK